MLLVLKAPTTDGFGLFTKYRHHDRCYNMDDNNATSSRDYAMTSINITSFNSANVIFST